MIPVALRQSAVAKHQVARLWLKLVARGERHPDGPRDADGQAAPRELGGGLREAAGAGRKLDEDRHARVGDEVVQLEELGHGHGRVVRGQGAATRATLSRVSQVLDRHPVVRPALATDPQHGVMRARLRE